MGRIRHADDFPPGPQKKNTLAHNGLVDITFLCFYLVLEHDCFLSTFTLTVFKADIMTLILQSNLRCYDDMVFAVGG